MFSLWLSARTVKHAEEPAKPTGPKCMGKKNRNSRLLEKDHTQLYRAIQNLVGNPWM